MTVALRDVGVLLALVWPNHPRHEDAQRWFAEARSAGWASTPLTELGVVRVSCIEAVVGSLVRPVDAVRLVSALRAVGEPEFWPDDVPIDDPAHRWDTLDGHRQVADARLLALVRQHRARLVTTDERLVAQVADPHVAVALPTE